MCRHPNVIAYSGSASLSLLAHQGAWAPEKAMHPAQRSKPACAPRVSQAPWHLQEMWVKGSWSILIWDQTYPGESGPAALTPRPPQAPPSLPVAFRYLEMPVSPEESSGFPQACLGGEEEGRERGGSGHFAEFPLSL